MNGTERINRLTDTIIASAIKVHTKLGPGLLEHAYVKCLAYELEKTGLKVASEMPLSLEYEQLVVDAAYRIDILVEDAVIVEIKAVEKVLPVHHAQLLTYLKPFNKRVGLLLNFNVRILPNGIKRMVNNF